MGEVKERNRGKNPGSAICEANSDIRATYRRKGVKKTSKFSIFQIRRGGSGRNLLPEVWHHFRRQRRPREEGQALGRQTGELCAGIRLFGPEVPHGTMFLLSPSTLGYYSRLWILMLLRLSINYSCVLFEYKLSRLNPSSTGSWQVGTIKKYFSFPSVKHLVLRIISWILPNCCNLLVNFTLKMSIITMFCSFT